MLNGEKPLRVLVIQPDPLCPPERLVQWLDFEQNEFVIVNPIGGDPVPKDTSGFDGLIVLGGMMGDGDDERYPWLQDVRDLLKESTENHEAVLGVCLGAQLLSAATGGKVELGDKGLEAGIVDVKRTNGAANDPLFAGVSENFKVAAMHQDVITELPENAEVLVTGAVYANQAFRINSSWGVQFHPELSPERFMVWLEEATKPGSAEELLMRQGHQDFVENDAELYASNRRIAKNFLNVIKSKQG